LALASGLSAQEDGVDHEGVKTLAASFSAAWERHDPAALADLWVADGDLVNPMGRRARGRAELAQFFRDEHASYMKGTSLTVKVTGARVLGPGLALLDCEAQLVGVKTPEGKALPPLKHLVFAVVTKAGERWQFVSARLSVPVPPPPDK
jgi:uncharacterized protein (TIGR02246 family)